MRHALAIGTVAALFAGPVNADTRDIGMTSAAKNEVFVVLGADRRGLRTGDRVFQEQQIRTGADSAAQLLFLDETALTVGPNSQLVLDKAVFDPDKKVGELSVRAVSGAFRFVSGSSPSGSYQIKTPAGTIGVRGTWIDLRILGDIVHVLIRRGSVGFCNEALKCIRVAAGHQFRANRANIGAPSRASPETLDSVVQLWFASGSSANLSQLAPGSGESTDLANFGGNQFWWQTSRDFQPDRSGQPPAQPVPATLPQTMPGPMPPLDSKPPPQTAPPPIKPPIVVIPPGPPKNDGFPPIKNPGIGTPPGLRKDTLPPGLANRGPGFLPPGQQKK